MTTVAEGSAKGVFRDAEGRAFISYVRDPAGDFELGITSIRTTEADVELTSGQLARREALATIADIHAAATRILSGEERSDAERFRTTPRTEQHHKPLSLVDIEEQLGVARISVVRPSDVARALGWVLLGEPASHVFAELRERGEPALPDPRWIDAPSVVMPREGRSQPGQERLSPANEGFWRFAERAAIEERVIIERSPPSGHSLVSLVGSGMGSLVAAAEQEPMLLIYSLGFLVIVRVVDPVLVVIGERLASRLRPDREP